MVQTLTYTTKSCQYWGLTVARIDTGLAFNNTKEMTLKKIQVSSEGKYIDIGDLKAEDKK